MYISASYDGCVRLYDKKSKSLLSCSSTHLQPITAMDILHSDKNSIQLVTASKDNTLLVQDIQISSGVNNIFYKCLGHEASVQCVASAHNSKRFISGDWSGHIMLWSLPVHDKEGITHDMMDVDSGNKSHVSKKRKMGVQESIVDRQEAVVDQIFQANSQCVSCVLWSNDSNIVTGGYDHCIRTWDVLTGGMLHTLHSNKVVTSMSTPSTSQQCSNPFLIASGHTDEKVRIWDTRSSAGETVIKMTLSSHKGWISSVKWCPVSSYLVASGSYDGDVKVWDIRSQVPLFTLEGEGSHSDDVNKVFDVDWSEDGKQIVSGGMDKQVHVYNINL